MQRHKEVTPGVYRLGTDVVNFYVLAEDGQLTVVDAGVPGHFEQLTSLLESRGWDLAAITAVLLTHAHADHVGFAERARTEAGATVRIHHADEIIATGGDDGRSNEKGMLGYLWRPALYKTLFDLLRGGGTSIVPVAAAASFDDGETLDVPGRPRVVHVPGHTRGSAALHLADDGVVFSGDALVTWNPLTGRTGPQIMPAAFNESSEQALRSLDRLQDLDAATVLPGHGDPWTDGVGAAASAARTSGPS